MSEESMRKRMATIRVSSQGTNYGSTVILGGRDISGYVSALLIDMTKLEDPPRAVVEINAVQGLKLELSAAIYPVFTVMPGWRLVVEERDGRSYYSVVEESVDERHVTDPTVQ